MADIRVFEEYQMDLKTKNAVERQLGIIGEAVNKYQNLEEELVLSDAKQIISFRNRIIHAYDNIDDTIVWAILHNFLPKLKKEAQSGLL